MFDAEGGGILCGGGSVNLSFCFISHNTALNGAGISAVNCNAAIYDTIFYNNSAGLGPAIESSGSNLTVMGCLITHNVASSFGVVDLRSNCNFAQRTAMSSTVIHYNESPSSDRNDWCPSTVFNDGPFTGDNVIVTFNTGNGIFNHDKDGTVTLDSYSVVCNNTGRQVIGKVVGTATICPDPLDYTTIIIYIVCGVLAVILVVFL